MLEAPAEFVNGLEVAFLSFDFVLLERSFRRRRLRFRLAGVGGQESEAEQQGGAHRFRTWWILRAS